MSDTILCPNDAATLALRDRASQLNIEIQDRLRRNEVAIAIRDELLEMIATLNRKSRPRKPRVIDAGPAPAAVNAAPSPKVFAAAANDDPVLDVTPRPTVFGTPAGQMMEAA